MNHFRNWLQGTIRRVKLLRRGNDESQNDVLKNMLVLAAGIGSAKVIGTLSIPLLTRIYSPQEFGIFSIFMSATMLVMPLASLRYAAALPLPRREETAAGLLIGGLILLTAVGFILSVILALFSESVFHLLSADILIPFWPLVILSFLAAGCYEIFSGWSIRRQSFRVISRAEISTSLIGTALKLALGTLLHVRSGLLIGHIAAQLAACAATAPAVISDLRRLGSRLSSRLICRALMKHTDFPLYRLPSQFLLMLASQAPLLFVNAMYGSAVAGQMGLAMTAVAVPLALVGQTTAQAYYAEIAKIGSAQPGRIYAISKNVSVKLFLAGLLPTAILLLAGPTLFAVIFGERWREAGVFSSLLSIYLLSQFVFQPMTSALSVFGRQGLFFAFNFARVVIVGIVFYFSYIYGLSATSSVGLYSVVLLIYYILNYVVILKIMRNQIKEN